MRLYLLPLLHLLTYLLPPIKPPYKNTLIAENLLLKQQLLILNRQQKRAPKLGLLDRCLLGYFTSWLSPKRLIKSAIIIQPSTILTFHRALVTKKYQRLFGQTIKAKPGPKGPTSELIQFIIKIKQCNPHYGCPQIARLINHRFGLTINKDVVRRILAQHYKPEPDGGKGPSWLSFIGHAKDSLWSVDLFRCESILLKSHWVMLVMDQASRRIVGLGVHAGSVDGPTLCRMYNQAVSGQDNPAYLSTDHDRLFRFHRWRANLRIRNIEEIKTVPYTPISHPFVERLIGTVRRELLDRTLFWNSLDLTRKLNAYKDYYNQYRVHSSINDRPPHQFECEKQNKLRNLKQYNWQSHCAGLFYTPEPT